MNWHDGDETARAPRTLKKGLRYFCRSMMLRCPTCGEKPIFPPARKVRSLGDWFTPLDGCPQCGYPYEREAGYFLMAIWGVNYGLIGLGGCPCILFYGSIRIGILYGYFAQRFCRHLSPVFFLPVTPSRCFWRWIISLIRTYAHLKKKKKRISLVILPTGGLN